MPLFCTSCGAPVVEDARFCPGCGKPTAPAATPVPPPVPSAASGGDLADNVAGMLAYITMIPAVIFLVLEPYNRRPFVRFHAFQCLFLTAVSIGLRILLHVFWLIPFAGWPVILVAPIIWLGVLVLVIICLIKAYQGQMWRVPVIGDLAAKQAGV